MKILLLLLLLVVKFASTSIVSTKSGIVIGSTVHYKGKSVKRFLGIPFAQPPVGNLRFKKTVPIQPWSKPLIAVTFPPGCVQEYPFDYPWVDKMLGNSEDCLYLNIWVPESDSHGDPKAVMFWIHGGGYSTGSNRLPEYDGHVLAAEGNVIVVTTNYRLGIFGFLSSKIEDAPGNMGLFDVLEALKWINNNIQAFGGDTNKITLFGNSAGGSISAFLTVSPLSVGLFQRIIMQSGSACVPRVDAMKDNFELGQKVAEALGCASEQVTLKKNPRAVVACLRNVPADVLVKTERAFKPTAMNTFFPIFGDKFLPVEPRESFIDGNFQDVDVLAGIVEDEGSISLVTKAPELFGPYGELDPKINKTQGADLIRQLFEKYPFKEDVVNYYLSGLSEYDYHAIRSQVYHSAGDYKMVCPTMYCVERFATRFKKVYYYYFGLQNLKSAFKFAPWMGVLHTIEIPFVFGRPLDSPSTYTESERKLSKLLIELWTSFAKEGVPSRVSSGVGCEYISNGSSPLHSNFQEVIKFNPDQCSRSEFSPLTTGQKVPSLQWIDLTYSFPKPYVQEIYVQKMNKNYLQHKKNCEFFRPYNGF